MIIVLAIFTYMLFQEKGAAENANARFGYIIVKTLINFFDYFSTMFFWYIFGVSLYWFVFFKL